MRESVGVSSHGISNNELPCHLGGSFLRIQGRVIPNWVYEGLMVCDSRAEAGYKKSLKNHKSSRYYRFIHFISKAIMGSFES